MVEAKLARYFQNDNVTLGVLKFNNTSHPALYTLELPWRQNEQSKSCIPTGIYDVVPYNSQRYKNVFQIKDVPGRSKILMHVGNYTDDTEGCVLPGLSVDPNYPMVGHSGDALRTMKIIAERFKLTVEDLC